MSTFFKCAFLFTVLGWALAVQARPPSDSPLAISHRACMVECPENTLQAIEWAAQAGADAIEIDLRATGDGELVVIHDKTVNRTTNGRGRVGKLTLTEIRSLDAGNGQRVPTMDEAFAFTRKTHLRLLLDLKDVRGIDPSVVYEALVRHQLTERVIIGARSVDQLIAFKALDSNLRTMAFTKSVGLIPRYIKNNVDIVRLWARWTQANPSLIDTVRSKGRDVWITTGVLRGEELVRLIESDTQGLITNYPGDVLQQRAANARTPSATVELAVQP